jgi:hypothetical protein
VDAQGDVMKHPCIHPALVGTLALIALLPPLVSCHSMELRRSARKAGVGGVKDEFQVLGTFENTARDKFGPKRVRLWEQLRNREWLYDMSREGEAYSDYGDRVQLTLAEKGLLKATLLSPQGKVRQQMRLPYSARSNHLHLHHNSEFGWLPLGYRASSLDIALTALPDGDLVLLFRYDVSGIVYLIGSAGTSGTVEFCFPRLRAGQNG